MPRISYSNVGTTPFEKLLGHNSETLKQWSKLETTLFTSGRLTSELKEQVRRVLAFGNGCEYCMAKGKPSDSYPNVKVAIATAFADIFVNHREPLDDNAFNVLKSGFTEEEISELCAFICFITASQTFGAMLNLKPE